MNETVQPHGFVTKGIHWLSAGLIGFGYLKGLDSVSQLADPNVLQFEVVYAMALGALFLVRLFWTKRIAGATRLPESAPHWEHIASRAVHMGLYASVFGIIGTGLLIALGFTTPVLSGLFLTFALGAHELMLSVMPIILASHVAGALWHKVVRRDGILESMTGRFVPRSVISGSG
ncbi:MAG: cytochrome b/b6 domain-containing protein [Litoreibacter sp.]